MSVNACQMLDENKQDIPMSSYLRLFRHNKMESDNPREIAGRLRPEAANYLVVFPSPGHKISSTANRMKLGLILQNNEGFRHVVRPSWPKRLSHADERR